jgi:hypothetical protein
MKTTTSQRRPITSALCSLATIGLAGCDSSNDTLIVDSGSPAVPTGVYTITGDDQVEVIWNPVRGNNVEGYGVYRSDTTVDGAYHRLATVLGEESDYYVDRGAEPFPLVNGRTYFYAVDAFNFQGQESELSYEDAFDTPRPAGTGVVLWTMEEDPSRAGVDFSAYRTTPSGRVLDPVSFDHVDADIYIERTQGVLYAKGRPHGGVWNDLQDLGYTDSMDEISWAPADGWSVSPIGVELIIGHTYVVWTWDEHFAKFRVTSMQVDSQTLLPTAIVIDWAYQVDGQNPELSPFFVARAAAGNNDREDS